MKEGTLLVKIAQMYYQEDKTQSQISKELNIHRSTISRLLKQSREEGIVQIKINYDKAGTHSIEEKLESQFTLQKAIVVPTPKDSSQYQRNLVLGKACSDYLNGIIEDEMIIGFSWGHAMASVSAELSLKDKNNLTCIPLVGGPAGKLAGQYHVNTITYEASKNLNAQALLIDAPAFPETVELKRVLMGDPFNQKLSRYWQDLDIALFGIGSPTMKESERWRNFYGNDVFTCLEEKQVAGDVISRFFDANGKKIPNTLDERIVGIEIDDLKKARYSIAVAESLEKVHAIRGAMLGGLCNVIITTQETAEAILKIN